MKTDWRENGIVLTAVAVAGILLFALAEQLVARRPPSPITVTVEAVADAEDEGDAPAAALAAVPLYGSIGELAVRARQLLAEPQPSPDLLHELARQARGFRDWTLADALLARCLELAPDRVETLFLRARTQSDLGEAERAAAMYEAVIALAPNHQKATYNRGVLARRAGDFARAEDYLTRAAAISSGRIRAKALHQRGLANGAAGRWDAAAQLLRESVNLRPDAERVWLDLGNAEQQRDRLDEAYLAYDQALALDRRFADAQLAMGRLEDLRGNHARARAHLERAVRIDGENAAYRMALAQHYVAGGDVPKARAALAWLSRNADEADRAWAEAMLALLSDDAERMLAGLKHADGLQPGAYDDSIEQAAALLHERKRYADARALLDLLLARPEPSPDVLLAAARTASRLAQWKEAESLLRRSLRARPQDSEAWFQLGRALSEQGRLAAAIDAYRASLARNPGARNTRLNLAVLQARAGKEREALALYAEILGAQPNYTPALLNRARLHERAGRPTEAIADLETAMRVAPADAGIRERLAGLLLNQGETDRARLLLADAVAESPGDAHVRLLLAQTELRAGRRADALRELNRAAVLAGDDALLWRQLSDGYRDAGDTAAAAQARSRANPRPESNTTGKKP